MENLERLIDPTHFGTVRRYLRCAHSPVTTVLLVSCRTLLSAVAAALLAADGRSIDDRRRQWARWFVAGDVRVGTHSPTHAYEADLDAVADEAICEVLFVPPVYLVCLEQEHRALFARAAG